MRVDDALLASAVAGDRIATGALLGLLHPGVLQYCRVRLGDRWHRDSDAEDCAQEVLIGVLGALPGYRYGAGKFLGFVYGVAAHKVVDAHRRRGAEVSVPVPEFVPEPSAQRGPLRHVEDLERRRWLHHLLGLLAPQQRDVVVLRVMFGLSAHDTAAVLGVASPGAVRVSQHRALAALRRHIAAAPVP
ncbi:sigma-70 family RNA polymerase sigma factor [Amycolatopsis kentuckyensis]|uniref:sigma-70 family RNA polymerase sigma factor n=1 Tax=Amycolatopsis kentuckyensis TaxID=218823 RepID=UPI000A37A3F3|nr:sigma-70 family RNA polymerase sigma factor [Amycolatopsis kentuckyensis]